MEQMKKSRETFTNGDDQFEAMHRYRTELINFLSVTGILPYKRMLLVNELLSVHAFIKGWK